MPAGTIRDWRGAGRRPAAQRRNIPSVRSPPPARLHIERAIAVQLTPDRLALTRDRTALRQRTLLVSAPLRAERIIWRRAQQRLEAKRETWLRSERQCRRRIVRRCRGRRRFRQSDRVEIRTGAAGMVGLWPTPELPLPPCGASQATIERRESITRGSVPATLRARAASTSSRPETTNETAATWRSSDVIFRGAVESRPLHDLHRAVATARPDLEPYWLR